jgi:hypothetical protein
MLIAGPMMAFAAIMHDDHGCDHFRPTIRLSAPHDAGHSHRHVNGNRHDVTNQGCCGTFCGGAVLPAYSATTAHHIWLVALIEPEPSESYAENPKSRLFRPPRLVLPFI